NELSITVQPILSPTISISASSLEICEGETIDFSSIVAAAGLDAIYEWQINGQVMGNTANFSTSTLNDGDVVRCKLQSLAPCTSTTEVLSNELTVIISEVLQPQLSITADATSICAGDTVYFTAQPQEAGANFELQWEWNGQVVGEGDINWQSTNLQEGDEVTCTMQTTALCSDTNFVRAPGLFFEVAPVLAPSISISASALTICSGETVDFSALVADAGSDFSFQWEVNQIPVNIDQVNFSIANLEDGDIIRCLLTSYYTCAFPAQVMSEELTIHVLPQLMPTIDVEVSATSICAGEEVIFAAYPNAAGDSLTYQWLRNSQEVGNDTTALILADLNDGDTVQCRLMTSHPCIEQGSILSDPIVIEVQPILHPSVEIIADTTSICAGEPIQFTAAHLEAGANPSYQWLLNGVLIVGANNLEWMVDSLSDGGVVQGQLISQSPCVIDSIAYSNELDIQVNPWVEATLSIETSATSICEGDTVLLEAFPTNGGQNPAYSWMINGIMVGDKPMWSTSTLADQDEVQCQMRSSAACVSEPLIEAASITFEVDECLVGLEDRSGSALIRLYPNPSTGWVYLDLQQDAFPISIAVMDLTGRHLMDGGHWEETNRLDLSHLSDGVYLIWIRGKDYSFKDQIIICK
ncbi:MAG: T9SS type A sorting domain-containing protein, partial [Bacteroidota bacterium]